MAKIFVFNNEKDKMETYYREELEPMPYNTNETLKVKEFKGDSKSNILWTTKRTMQSWNSQRYIFGKPILIDFAFKRPYEGGYENQSQHYAGTAFNVGKNMEQKQRNKLWSLAYYSGIWCYVKPYNSISTEVYFDKRFENPLYENRGFPIIKKGSLSNYVLIAQDDLNTLGFKTNGLDGIFGEETANAVKSYQRKKGLVEDGIVGCNTWKSLQEDVIGAGPTSTTIN